MSLKTGLASLVVTGVSLSACGSSVASSAAKKVPNASKVTTTAAAATTTSTSALFAWTVENESVISQLGGDMNAISKDAPKSSAGFPKMIGDCANLEVDSQAALAGPAVQQAAIEADWTQGLGQLIQAAKDCITGYENVDAQSVQRFITEENEANQKLNVVLETATGING